MKSILPYLILLCLSSSSLYAQQTDILKAIEGLESVYEENANLQHTIEYRLFSGIEHKKLHSVEKGLFISQGINTYSKIGEIESYNLKSSQLYIDNEDQLVVVSNPIKQQSCTKNDQLEILKQFQNYLQLKKYAVQTNGLLATFPSGEYQSFEIQFHPSTFIIQKIVIQYRRKVKLKPTDDEGTTTRLEIVYTSTSFSPSDIPKVNIRQQKEEWQLYGHWSAYRLINNFIKEKS